MCGTDVTQLLSRHPWVPLHLLTDLNASSPGCDVSPAYRADMPPNSHYPDRMIKDWVPPPPKRLRRVSMTGALDDDSWTNATLGTPQSMASYGRAVKINKTCEQCRLKKVRCIVPPQTRQADSPFTCVNCINRKETCNFGVFRSRRVSTPPGPLLSMNNDGGLYIDRLLQQGPQKIELFEESTMFKVPDGRVKTCAMAFFSNKRMASLSEKLGTEYLTELVERLDIMVQKRTGQGEAEEARASTAAVSFANPQIPEKISPQIAKAFIQAYFENIQPLYPFLDQEEFCAIALAPNLDYYLARDPVFSCLYHAVLALGSQYFHGGGFVPRLGQAWGFFQVSLGLLPQVLAPPHSLVNLQALTAMSVFSLNPCCVQLELTIMTQAPRMAHTLRYHQTSNSQLSKLKAFWVVYYFDKMANFAEGVSSLLADEDIGCAIPHVAESFFGDYNWSLSSIKLGRLTSIAYSSLFSVTAASRSKETLRKTIPVVRQHLETWRLSVPPRFRPEEPIQLEEDAVPSAKFVFLETQYHYHNILIAVEKLSLQVDVQDTAKRQESMYRLMQSAQTVIELTRFIDTKGFVNIFMCAIMPLASLFILFDFVIHNPTHTETGKNLILLEKAATHFRDMEAVSRSILPGEIIWEFAAIARQYVTRMVQGADEAWKHILATQPQSSGFGMANLNLANSSSESSQGQLATPPSTHSDKSRLETEPSHQAPQTLELLDYPTDDTMQEASTSSSDVRNLFGWVFGDWEAVSFP